MATIDDIRIKLGVDAVDVSTGVNALNKSLDGLRKERTAKVRLSVVPDRGIGDELVDLKKRIAALGTIPISIDPGNFDASAISKKLEDDFRKLPGGGVGVPVRLDTKLTAHV